MRLPQRAKGNRQWRRATMGNDTLTLQGKAKDKYKQAVISLGYNWDKLLELSGQREEALQICYDGSFPLEQDSHLYGYLGNAFIVVDGQQQEMNHGRYTNSAAYSGIGLLLHENRKAKTELVLKAEAIIGHVGWSDKVGEFDLLTWYLKNKIEDNLPAVVTLPFAPQEKREWGFNDHILNQSPTFGYETPSGLCKMLETIGIGKRALRKEPYTILDTDFLARLQKDVRKLTAPLGDFSHLGSMEDTPFDIPFPSATYLLHFILGERQWFIAGIHYEKHKEAKVYSLGGKEDLAGMVSFLQRAGLIVLDSSLGSKHLEEQEEDVLRAYGFSLLESNHDLAVRIIRQQLGKMERFSLLRQIPVPKEEQERREKMQELARSNATLISMPLDQQLLYLRPAQDEPTISTFLRRLKEQSGVEDIVESEQQWKERTKRSAVPMQQALIAHYLGVSHDKDKRMRQCRTLLGAEFSQMIAYVHTLLEGNGA